MIEVCTSSRAYDKVNKYSGGVREVLIMVGT